MAPSSGSVLAALTAALADGSVEVVDLTARLPSEAPVIGVGVETVGTDAVAAHSFDPPFPCHASLMGSGKYGLTQLQNLASLPATGVLLIAATLPIVSGSG